MSGSRALMVSSRPHFVLKGGGAGFEGLDFLFEFGLFGGVLLFFELAHEGAHFLGGLVLLGLEFLEFLLGGTFLGIEFEEAIDIHFHALEFCAFLHGGGVFADEFQVEHGIKPL